MNILLTLKRVAYSTAFSFMTTLFVFMGIFTLFYEDLSMTQTKAIPLSQYPWILLFAFVMAWLNHLLTSTLLNVYMRVGIHFCGTMAAIYLIFIETFKMGQSGSSKLSLMIVFSIVYAIVLAVSFAIRRGAGLLASTIEKSQKKKAQDAETQE